MQKSTIRTQQLYNRENNTHEIVKAKEIKMEKLAHEEKADSKWILLPLFLVWMISCRFFYCPYMGNRTPAEQYINLNSFD